MSTSRPVRKRHVFYIPGYDPIPPRRYRELYRTQSVAQARISGYEIAITPGKSGDSYGWQVAARINGTEVETRIDVLVWSDIVQSSMSGSIFWTYLLLIRTVWTYLRCGALFRLMRLRKGPVIAALYPVAMLLGQLAVAYVSGWFAYRLAAFVFSDLGLIGSGLALSSAVFIGIWILQMFKRWDRKLFAYYLLHDYAYTACENGAIPAGLRMRLDQFEARITAALGSDVDEVLVVGHSSGAHLAVSVLANILRERPKGPDQAPRPALAFLSLGQVIPMVSFLPDANVLRADLHLLSASESLAWVDVSAPGDGCAFALCDPVAVSGVAPENKRWPLVLSAAFTQTLAPQTWARLRWRFFRLHFQYLCAFDRPGDYDYFQITAGPVLLKDRYAGRAASRSRIERALSGHVSMAA